ncbi:MAG: mechanosensitive ion channel family protein [Vicinamibacterales bacterium]|nr:mechanosensitive ion channel family protein [Vicinamibacterales bacterium]
MNDTLLKGAVGAGLFLFALALRSVSRNRLVRRKLLLTLTLAGAYVAIALALAWYPVGDELKARVSSLNQLGLALAVINLLVAVTINPLREDRVPERFPTIVQDTLIIALFAIVATGVMPEKFLTTSAVGAVVIGFALQDTLGNMFAGLALQVEKPFRVGHWVAVGHFEGMVTEVTWRATKLRTKAGNQVVLPNAFISKEAIINYSEPSAPTRLEIVVGVSYDVPPARVKAAIQEAVDNAPLVLAVPPAEVLVDDFASSSMNYRVRFWIEDFARDTVARDQVRGAIYYSLRRHNYEIPFPMQVEMHREPHGERTADRLKRLEHVLSGVDLFTTLPEPLCRDLAGRADERLFGPGDAIVRQGAGGSSMFVIADGTARVVEASGHELATLGPGNYFGEMSMLTGQPRSATVLARGECHVLELTAEALRAAALEHPDVLRRISAVVAERRADLDRHVAEAARIKGDLADLSQSLLTRIQTFLRLPDLFRN